MGLSRCIPERRRAPAAAVPEPAATPGAADAAPVPTGTAAEAGPSSGDCAAMIAGGPDFAQAIQAHQRWTARLAAYLGGSVDEVLDHRIVCRDDQCVLGRWIHGAGGRSYGRLPSFAPLQACHARFHEVAGEVVRLHEQGTPLRAGDTLRNGRYPQYSARVQRLLATLHGEVAAATPPARDLPSR